MSHSQQLFRNDGTPTGISIAAPCGTRTKYVLSVTGSGKGTMFSISPEMGIEQAYIRAVDLRLEHLLEQQNEQLRADMLRAFPLLLKRYKLKLRERIVYDIVPDED